MMAWRLVAEKNNRACDRQKSRQLLFAAVCYVRLCSVVSCCVSSILSRSSFWFESLLTSCERSSYACVGLRRVVCHQLSLLDCGPSPVIASCDGDR
jgi:hypothetical protein